jgi:hypothetical protein
MYLHTKAKRLIPTQYTSELAVKINFLPGGIGPLYYAKHYILLVSRRCGPSAHRSRQACVRGVLQYGVDGATRLIRSCIDVQRSRHISMTV